MVDVKLILHLWHYHYKKRFTIMTFINQVQFKLAMKALKGYCGWFGSSVNV